MQIFSIILIFSLVFSVLSFVRSIEIAKFLKFNLSFFALRIISALIFYFYFSEISNTPYFKNLEMRFLFFSISLYVFTFYFYSKVILKNFLRVGEVLARFSLDAMPGEQMAIESSKRDGILSLSAAQASRTKTVKNSLKYTSFETVLRILSSEPVVISLLISVSIIFSIFDYQETKDLLKLRIALTNFFLVGSLLLISGILTVMPISKFTLGENLEENVGNFNLNFFYYEVIKYSSYLIMLLAVFTFIYYFIDENGFQSINQVSILVLIGALSIYASFKLRVGVKGKFLIVNLDDKKISNEKFSPLEQRELDKLDDDLEIYLESKIKASEIENFLKKLTLNILEMESLLIGVSRIILRYEDAHRSNSYLKFNWKGEIFETKLGPQTEDWLSVSINFFLRSVSKILVSSLITSDIIKKLNQEYFSNSHLSFIGKLDFANFDFISRCVNRLHSMGIVATNLVSLVEHSMSSFDDLDENLAISNYLESNSQIFEGIDGICRVLFLDKIVDPSRIRLVIDSLKFRNVFPIILISSEENQGSEFSHLGSVYSIEKDFLPSDIEFFPLPSA